MHVDSWLSNMPDLPVSLSWLVLMLTNIAQYDLDEPSIKRIKFADSDIFMNENQPFYIFGECVNDK